MIRNPILAVATSFLAVVAAPHAGAQNIPQAATDNVGPNEALEGPAHVPYGKPIEDVSLVYKASPKQGLTPVVLWLPEPGWRYSGPAIDKRQMSALLVNSGVASAIIGTRDARDVGTTATTSEIIAAIVTIVAKSAEMNIDPHRMIIAASGSALTTPLSSQPIQSGLLRRTLMQRTSKASS